MNEAQSNENKKELKERPNGTEKKKVKQKFMRIHAINFQQKRQQLK